MGAADAAEARSCRQGTKASKDTRGGNPESDGTESVRFPLTVVSCVPEDYYSTLRPEDVDFAVDTGSFDLLMPRACLLG